MITISTVIPTYNREATIGRCIQSVLDQTVKPTEIIVVDDGSQDHTKEIVNEYAMNSTIPIILLHQKNKGAQAARNYGIKTASGDYIAFLDSDDEWLPRKTESQMKYINDKTVVYCDCFVENDIKNDIEAYEDKSGHGLCRVRTEWKLRGGNGYVYKEMLMYGGPCSKGLL